MPFVDTFNSLKNYVLNNRLSKSLEKATTVTSANSTFTVDPNASNMFLITVAANSSIALSSLDSEYTSTGSVITILLTKSASSYTVTWPNTINWQSETAPELSHKNLITLMHFGETNTWYGGAIQIDDNY